MGRQSLVKVINEDGYSSTLSKVVSSGQVIKAAQLDRRENDSTPCPCLTVLNCCPIYSLQS
jgi:hypothetical protein